MKKNTKKLLFFSSAALLGMYAYNRFVEETAAKKNMLPTENGAYYPWNQGNIFYTKEGNVESPFVSRTCTPKIAGVLVVAEGAGDSVVKQEILSSVQSLFAIEAHKITVVKMSMQEGEVP